MADSPTTREQLSMFFVATERAATADPEPTETPPPQPEERPNHVSAGRQLRALQRSIPLEPPAKRIPLPRIVGGVCEERANRLQPDGTLAPCFRVTCPRHLAIDIGDPVVIGPTREAALICSTAGQDAMMGRRPELSAYPDTYGEVEAFGDLVVERIPYLPWSCDLDLIAQYPDGAPLDVIARALGVSEEVVRRDLNSAEALRDDACETVEDAIEEAAPRMRRAPRKPSPSKLASPGAIPAAIVRREEQEPPPAPRMLTADDVFTF